MKFKAKLITTAAVLSASVLCSSAQTVGYYAKTSTPYGGAANNSGLNIGHTFTVTRTNLIITALGAYDFGSDGLNSSHIVTLFSNQTALVSVTVPAGTEASLQGGFRFATLPEAVSLQPGNYAVVAYQMNGNTANSDGYGDYGNPKCTGFNGSFTVHDGMSIYEFTANGSAYPGTGGNSLGSSSANLASASFLYVDPNPTTIAYTADPISAKFGDVANNLGLNIGHNFTVTGDGIKVFNLGVFDYQANGLNAAHTVTLLSRIDGASEPVSGGSVTVPAGTEAILGSGFRFAALDEPIILPAGDYTIVAYGMNGGDSSDGYAEENASGFNGCDSLNNSGYSPFEFTSNESPAFPSSGAGVNFACASFDYVALSTNSEPTEAYTASVDGPYGAVADNAGLNIGHSFSISGTNILITDLGVYDYAGDGLVASHTVTLFANVGGTFQPISGASVTVPAGDATTLLSGHRFQPLATPIALPPGNYAVIAYQMNGGAESDPYSDVSNGNNGMHGGAYISDTGSYYEFTTSESPAFPTTTENKNFGCASFVYTLSPTSSLPVGAPVISPSVSWVNVGGTTRLTASTTGSGTLEYQWYYGVPATLIPNATNATLVLTNVQAVTSVGNQGVYSVSVKNATTGPIMSTTNVAVHVVPAGTPLKIMPLGDSITDGVGFTGGYRAPLFKMLAAANYNVNFVGNQNNNAPAWLPQPNHEGHSGFRIDQLVSSFVTWVNAISNPDVILLLIGTNDYGQDNDTAHATNRLDQLIGVITKARPNAKLIVANLTVRTDYPEKEAAIEATFNPYVPSIVAKHAALGENVSFVDMHSALDASDLGDQLHPNESGYNKMAATWFKAITTVVPPLGSTNATVKVTGSNIQLNYAGIPQYSYIIQRSTNLSNATWQPISTNVVPVDGVLQFPIGNLNSSETMPPAAFFRVIQQR
jgi:lysophospholipase L1-like esterase